MRFEEVRAEGLAYWLNDHQWIDWFDGEDDMITRIIDTIKRQAGNDQAQTVSPLTARIPPPVSPPPTLAATPAPDGQGSGSQWMAPVVTAVIVDLGMLAGLYFMARGMMRKSPCKPLGLRRSTRQEFESCSGVSPIVERSDDYSGFASSLTVLMTGGYTDAHAANAALKQAQARVVDAYIRSTR